MDYEDNLYSFARVYCLAAVPLSAEELFLCAYDGSEFHMPISLPSADALGSAR
jgi:hypothetical protein